MSVKSIRERVLDHLGVDLDRGESSDYQKMNAHFRLFANDMIAHSKTVWKPLNAYSMVARIVEITPILTEKTITDPQSTGYGLQYRTAILMTRARLVYNNDGGNDKNEQNYIRGEKFWRSYAELVKWDEWMYILGLTRFFTGGFIG